MKKNFKLPELEIILFGNDDVILTSAEGPEDDWGGGDKWDDDPNA